MTSSSATTQSSLTALKGLESRKSNTWWWDSQVGRNTKWLAENLEETDQHYKRMLKLIEGDGDSLAKKADMYYQKRPELLSHVEEFYRMYKSLAERYKHLTGEVRKNIPADLQSQVSIGSDISTDTIYGCSTQESKISLRKPGPRAAGFDFFLGPKKSNYDRPFKGDETPSTSDTETEISESDESSLYSYSGITVTTGEEGLQIQARPLELEADSFEVQVKSQENRKIEDYEEELKIAKEKIHLSEEEIVNLKTELQKFRSLESTISMENDELNDENENGHPEINVSQLEQKIRALSEELIITKKKLEVLDKENKDSSGNIRKMQDVLKLSQKEANTWKTKIESKKQQVAKLQERIARYKARLTDRENEVRDLKEVISDRENEVWDLKEVISGRENEVQVLKEVISDRENEVRDLKEAISDQENEIRDLKEAISGREKEVWDLKEVISDANQLHSEISRLTDDRTLLEEKLRELEMQYHSLETRYGELERKLTNEIEHLKSDIAEKTHRIETLESDLDKTPSEEKLRESEWEMQYHSLKTQYGTLERKLTDEIEHLKADISEKTQRIETLECDLDPYKFRSENLSSEKDELNTEISIRNDQFSEIEKCLKLLVTEKEETSKVVEQLREEVEKERVMVQEAAEGKREAIRQLCVSLEHYRNCYQQLRQAFTEHKISGSTSSFML